MEDKRGTKHSRSPSQEGSSSSSGSSTPSSALSGSPPLPGSPSEISSCLPCSPVFEQGGPSEKVPMVDLRMRNVSSLTPRGMRSSPKDSLMTSIVTSLGRPALTRSSSSATLTKKKWRNVRRMSLTLKLHHLLLQSPRPQPPLSMMSMTPIRVTPLIRR
jgi:hypothetical protein